MKEIKVTFLTLDELGKQENFLEVEDGFIDLMSGTYICKKNFSNLEGTSIFINEYTYTQQDLCRTGDVLVPFSCLKMEPQSLLNIIDERLSDKEVKEVKDVQNTSLETSGPISSHINNTKLLKSGVIEFPQSILNLLKINQNLKVSEDVFLTLPIVEKWNHREISSLSYSDILMISHHFLDFVIDPVFEVVEQGIVVNSVLDVMKMVLNTNDKYILVDKNKNSDEELEKALILLTDKNLLTKLIEKFKNSSLTLIKEN